MKLPLYKILLRHRIRDEGYTLPMVIALGLVMILLGTTNIVKSSEENLNASIQNSSSDALAIAEVGIAKYREFLNQNRVLTVYNHDQWTSNNVGGVDVAGQTCNNINNPPPGWTGATTGANNPANWWNVTEDVDGDGTAETIGQYRLVRYIYDVDGDTTTNDNGNFNVTTDANTDDDPPTPIAGVGVNSIDRENDTDDDGESDARGILTVQGRRADGSEAQISVDIPLRINDFDNLAPVVWVADGAIANPGNLTVQNGNIVLSNSGTNCPIVPDINGNTAINDPRNLPDIVDITSVTNAEKNALSINLNAGTDPELLPMPSAMEDDKFNDRFFYEINNPVSINDNDIEIDGVSDVTLYLDSNLTTIGDVTIGNFNSATSNISSKNLEIQIEGNRTITLGGDVEIEALIHAPESTLTIPAGSNVTINGAVWVRNINNAGNLTIIGDSTDTTTITDNSYKFYTATNTRSPRPIASSPTNWVKEEVE